MHTSGEDVNALEQVAFVLSEAELLETPRRREHAAHERAREDERLVLHTHHEAVGKRVQLHLHVEALKFAQHPVVNSCACNTITKAIEWTGPLLTFLLQADHHGKIRLPFAAKFQHKLSEQTQAPAELNQKLPVEAQTHV